MASSAGSRSSRRRRCCRPTTSTCWPTASASRSWRFACTSAARTTCWTAAWPSARRSAPSTARGRRSASSPKIPASCGRWSPAWASTCPPTSACRASSSASPGSRRPSARRRDGLGLEPAPRGEVGLVGARRKTRPLQLEAVDGPHEDGGDERLREPLLVGGDYVPRRPGRRRRAQRGVVSGEVLVPALTLLDVVGVERPLALGRVQAREEAALLLVARDVQEELDDLGAVAVEVALERVDVLVASLPDPRGVRPVGQPLQRKPLGVHAQRDDLLVVRAVEDPDPPALGRGLHDPPQERVVELLRGRLLEADDLHALRVDARHHMADRAVLAGGVHRLEDDEQRPAVAGPR